MSRRRVLTFTIAAAAVLLAGTFVAGGEARAAKKKAATAAMAQAPAPHPATRTGPPASVVVDHPGGARRVAATVQGRILDEAFPAWGAGERRIVLLIEPQATPGAGAEAKPASQTKEGTTVSINLGSDGGGVNIQDTARGGAFTDTSGTRWLAWVDPSGEGRAEIVRRDIPGDVRAIDAIDRDGDGNEDIAFWRPGGIWIARSGPEGRPDGRLEPLITDPDLEPGSNEARALCTPDCVDDRRLWTGIVGSLRAYGPGADGSWTRIVDIPMPVNVSKSTRAFELKSPLVRSLPPKPGGRRMFAIGPEPFGSDRLRTLLVDPSQPPETPPIECWSRLPGPEALIESNYVWIGEKPALVVTTRSAVKLGIFAEKWLRVFTLAEDRTNRGQTPVLALETKMNLWQSTIPRMLDVDRDGRDDLVLPYWKGLSKGHVEIDAYLQAEDGTFSRSARTTAFEVPEGNRSFISFSRDFDGDGRTDLLISQNGKLEIHAGSARSKKGDDLVEPAARFALPLDAEGAIHVNMPQGSDGDEGDESGEDGETESPSTFTREGSPRLIDLDGDGRSEIVVRGGAGGDGRIVVFSIPLTTPH
jgi:hypothetical protein